MSYGRYRGGRRQPRRYQRPYRRGRRAESASFWGMMAGSPWPSYAHRGRYRRQGGGVVLALILVLVFLFLIIHYWWIVVPILILLVIGIILIVNAFRAKFNPNYQRYKPLNQPQHYSQPDQPYQQGQGQYYQPRQSAQQAQDQYYQPDGSYNQSSQQPSGGHYAIPKSHYPQNPPPTS